MADDLYDVLMRFHRQVVQPEFEELRGEMREMRGEMVTRSEMLSYMDDIYKRFDRLEANIRL
jgi:hypothetical protein